MQPKTVPVESAEKYERLKKNSLELARMNAELVSALKRQRDEINALVTRNEEVLSRCEEYFAAEHASTNGNGNHAGKGHQN